MKTVSLSIEWRNDFPITRFLSITSDCNQLSIAQLAERWTVVSSDHPSVTGSIPVREIFCLPPMFLFTNACGLAVKIKYRSERGLKWKPFP